LSKLKGASLQQAVDEYLKRRGMRRRLAQANVVVEWEQLVGPQLARISEPVSVDQSGTLWVRVKSAAWIQELQMMSPTILKTLGRKGRPVTYIRWIASSGDPVDDATRSFERKAR